MIKRQGFTLIEVMIALIIFAIIASITASAMHNTLTSREHLTKHMEQLTKWQLAVTMLERDFTQIVDRPIRTGKMLERAALIGTPIYVEFTRGGVESMEGVNLQRAAWICDKESLIRRHWLVLDPPNIQKYHDKHFLDNLKACKFEYITHKQTIKPSWNTDTNIQGTMQEHMPLAIKIKLNTNTNEILSFPFRIIIFINVYYYFFLTIYFNF